MSKLKNKKIVSHIPQPCKFGPKHLNTLKRELNSIFINSNSKLRREKFITNNWREKSKIKSKLNYAYKYIHSTIIPTT